MASNEQVAELLARTLDFRLAREAESGLAQLETVPGFPLTLLEVVASNEVPLDTRLAGSLFFKNLIKKRWTDIDGNYQFSDQDVNAIKTNILNLMVSTPPQPRKQLAESVSIIASSDFPDRWPDLVPQLVSKLEAANPEGNNTVLSVLHSVFERWRHLARSDALFLEIKLVLDQFSRPFLELMLEADRQITTSGSLKWVESMDILVQIFYDLNCQDLPEFFEDHLAEFMKLLWTHLSQVGAATKNANGDEDDCDDEAGPQERLGADICEALTLYTQRYEEEFSKYMPEFVEVCWKLLTTVSSSQKYDFLVNRSLAFLCAVAKFERNVHMFENDTLVQVIQRVIVPNIALTANDVETLSDEPLDFVRKDLEDSKGDTRRQAATAFLRELASKLEGQVTKVVMSYITEFLNQYQANPAQNWRQKTTAVALFSAIAAKGQITAAGVSTTNLLTDVVQFFNMNMAPELNANQPQPVLKIDAIRFILAFRNQLSKEQLASALRPLAELLSGNEHPAVYTYSAVTLERILALRDPVSKRLMFGEHDIPIAGEMAVHALSLAEAGMESSELQTNEFLVRFVMRALLHMSHTARPVIHQLMPQLVRIIAKVAENPSNPRFNHYLFECLGACLKQVHTYTDVESTVLQPLFTILGADVTEFVPYILQILTLVLTLQPVELGLPNSYQMLLNPLLSPALWEARGNVPALVGLLNVIVQRGPTLVLEMELLVPLLGVFQSLLASRAREKYAFELLETILLNIPLSSLAPYLGQIAKLLIVKLNAGSVADQYLLLLSRFVFFIAASTEPLGPSFVISFFDTAESAAFRQLFAAVVLPKSLQIHGSYHRRIAAIGLTRILCDANEFLSGEYASLWPEGMSKLVGLLTREIPETSAAQEGAQPDIDINELSFGSSFSPLVTASIKKTDPVAYIEVSADRYFVQELRKAAQAPAIQQLLNTAFNDVEKQYLSAALNSQ